MNKSELHILIKSLQQLQAPREESIFAYFMGFSEEELGKIMGETRNGSVMNARYQVTQIHKDTAQAFELGYQNKNNGTYDEFIKLVKNYLSQTYAIENYFNSWVEQVDHYAFLKTLDWVAGFFLLLEEIYQNIEFFTFTERKEKVISFTEISQEKEEILDSLTIKHTTINVGDIIELTDLIGTDYQQTKYYDMSIRNPSWELFYPSEKDFKFIKFFHEDKKQQLGPITYERVWRLFSGWKNTVLAIKKRKDQYFLYTEIFEIEVEGAIKEKEFLLSNDKTLPSNALDINEHIRTYFEYYRLALISPKEFLSGFPFTYFFCFRKDWQRYRRHFMVGIGRNWTPVS